MGETNITINFDAAKLDALEFALRKQRSSVQRRMAEMLQQLYEAEVPEAVREYVDKNVDFCGILNLLAALKRAGFPKTELEQVAMRIAVQTGATISISF